MSFGGRKRRRAPIGVPRNFSCSSGEIDRSSDLPSLRDDTHTRPFSIEKHEHFPPLNALVIPFVDSRKPQGNYWPTLAEELEAWKFVAKVLASAKPKVGQNGKYDIEYLWAKYGIPVNNYADDTMLLHHSLLPESPKGLAFLGSVYTDEAAWKLNRPKGKHTEKPEDEE